MARSTRWPVERGNRRWLVELGFRGGHAQSRHASAEFGLDDRIGGSSDRN
jgi:hypothetical protein